MKAIVFSRYGTTSDLVYRDVDQPVPDDDEVLVRIHASSVNDWDWVLLHGKSPINRLLFGLFRPRINTLRGQQVSGQARGAFRE